MSAMKLRLVALFIISQIFCLASSALETSKKISSTEQTPLIGRITPSVSLILSGFSNVDKNSFASPYRDRDKRLGTGAGVTVDIGRSNLVLETGLLYQQLGSDISSIPIPGFNFIGALSGGPELKLDYLAIPIEAKYYFSGQEKSSWYVKGGLIPSFLVSKYAEISSQVFGYQNGGFGWREQTTSTNDVPANNIVVPVIIGIGGKMNVSDHIAIILETTYQYSMTPIFTDSPNSTISAISFTTGLDIDL
jgi:hypothetical protein